MPVAPRETRVPWPSTYEWANLRYISPVGDGVVPMLVGLYARTESTAVCALARGGKHTLGSIAAP